MVAPERPWPCRSTGGHARAPVAAPPERPCHRCAEPWEHVLFGVIGGYWAANKLLEVEDWMKVTTDQMIRAKMDRNKVRFVRRRRCSRATPPRLARSLARLAPTLHTCRACWTRSTASSSETTMISISRRVRTVVFARPVATRWPYARARARPLALLCDRVGCRASGVRAREHTRWD